jgi:hypothetical protein
MGSIINTRTYFNAQVKLLDKIYSNSAPFKPLRYPSVFNMYKGDADRSFFQTMPLVGFGTLSEKTEGAVPVVDYSKEGTPSLFPYVSYALRYIVTKEMTREDAKHIIPKLPGQLRYSSDQTKEFLFWNVFNLAFNNAVTLGDGQPLCSAAHPLLGASSQPGINGYSNLLGNVSLTTDTLQQAYVLMADIPDDRGLKSYRTPQQLIYPLGLDQTAKEVLSSSYYPTSDENRVNVVAGSIQPMPIEYLTANPAGPFPWFVLAGKGDPGTDAHTVFADVKWDEQRSYVDDPTNSMIQETEFRAVWGAVDARGIVGSSGA